MGVELNEHLMSSVADDHGINPKGEDIRFRRMHGLQYTVTIEERVCVEGRGVSGYNEISRNDQLHSIEGNELHLGEGRGKYLADVLFWYKKQP